MSSWFPPLHAYTNFNTRLNFSESVFFSLIPILLEDIKSQNMVKSIRNDISLIGSLPIKISKGKNSRKVAAELSDKSYCPSESMFYCGVKLHLIANKVDKKIPFPNFVSVTSASENDSMAIGHVLSQLNNHTIVLIRLIMILSLKSNWYKKHLSLYTCQTCKRSV